MRKLALGLTAGTLLLLGCTQNEVSDLAPNSKSLHFSTYVGKQTRASEFNSTSWAADAKFTIKAYLDNNGWKTYFTDTLCYNAPNWTLKGPDRFQVPYATKYIATFPDQEYTDEGSNFTDKFPSFTYTADGGTDLIGAVSDHKKLETKINLPFRHLLSQINFGVYEYPGAKIAISNIKISGIKAKGTFTFKPIESTKTDSYEFIGSWTLIADKSDLQKYAYEFGKNNTFTTEGASAVTSYVFGDGGSFAADNNNNSVKYVYPDGVAYGKEDVKRPKDLLSNSLMLLPQEIADFTANDATLTFEYTVTDMSGNIIGQNNKRNGVIKLADLKMAWKSNYRYIYMLNFDFTEDLFTFGVDIESWENH